MRLETEVQALRAFTPAVKAELPFLIPHMAGSVRQGELSTFVYSHLAGTARSLEALAAGGRAMAQELGHALAAIHELPQEMVQRADLPSYEANEYRQRKLNELDQAATTGKIPSILLRRWEHALEDVTLWRFSPTVMHGDLHEDHLLISAGRVSAVTGWTDLCIGDPAEDFAWLAAAEDAEFVEAVYAAYSEDRGSAVDPHLARRAALAAEFALAQWLVRGVALEDAAMVAEAEDMLATLEEDVEAIEREQQEATERAQRTAEERREWGDELGTDADRYHSAGRSDTNTIGLPPRPPTSAGTVTGGSVPGRNTFGTSTEDPRRTPRAGEGAAGDQGIESTPAPQDPADRRNEGPGRTGSHAYGSTAEADAAGDETPQQDGVDGEPPSGASLAYARMMAARPQNTTSSKVTLLSTSQSGEESGDDVETSALPIVSFGRRS
jgi:aminoglycoside phosphotransferase (APT) family kinase protein